MKHMALEVSNTLDGIWIFLRHNLWYTPESSLEAASAGGQGCLCLSLHLGTGFTEGRDTGICSTSSSPKSGLSFVLFVRKAASRGLMCLVQWHVMPGA